MTLETDLADLFRKNEWVWHLKGGKVVIPDEADIMAALDETARLLYDEEVGTQLEVGHLIIVKRHRGHDVYVYYGDYL